MENGFKVGYYLVEIGSRGFISKTNDARLKSIFMKNSNDIKYSNIKQIHCKIAVVSSFIIYHSKYEDK